MNTPKHVVLFPDGNRRWARAKGLNTLEGHKKGYENLLDFAEWCKKRGVEVLTAFGFSTENWNRSPEEVSYLMKLLEDCLVDNLNKYMKDGVRVRVIGDKKRLPKSLQEAAEKVEAETRENKSLSLNLAISYGGRWDIVNAAKKIIEEGTPADQLTEEIFEKHLSTAGLPAPDFVIRAGGEKRMSNFVLWQAAYAELYFCPKMWPEFSEADLDEAFIEFDRRTRRFGK